MRVGDFFDAIEGFFEMEADRFRRKAELIRTATTYIVNTQPIEGGARTAQQLWPFPWDKEEEGKVEVLTEEEAKRRQEAQDAFLLKNF